MKESREEGDSNKLVEGGVKGEKGGEGKWRKTMEE